MTIFYKACRMDGRDFYSGRVNYARALASGEPLPELSCGVAFPGPGWYHLATVPTECMGMSWPCRLFEVEPVGETFMDNAHPHKIGCRSVRVLREIDAHRVFGPQGEQVVALIERCRVLSAVEVDRLAAAWDAAWDTWATRYAVEMDRLAAAWDAAWDTWATRYAVEVDRLAAAWVAARDAAWVAARDAARNAACVAMDRLDAARYAARDAACGLLCRDLIGQYPGWDQAAYDLLTGPWRDAIGPIHPDDAPPVSDSYLAARSHQIAVKESEQSDG